MMTTATKSTAQANSQTRTTTKGHGKQGFASMDKETVRKIAAKGGRASHSNQGNKETLVPKSKASNSIDSESHGKQGFASMSKEQIQEAGRKGGEASHSTNK